MPLALPERRPGPGRMFPSDRGSQTTPPASPASYCKTPYNSKPFTPSSVLGQQVAESWSGTYKLEMIEGRSWRSITHLRAETWLSIEGLVNLRRPRSSLNSLNPGRVPTAALLRPRRYSSGLNQTNWKTGAIPLASPARLS